MLSYAAHTIIFSSYILFLIVAATLILLKLPLSRFVGLVGLVFGFVQEQHSEEESIAITLSEDKPVIINVCGDQFYLRNKFSSRLPFMLAVGATILISIIVFVDGCVFSTRHVYNDKQCVIRTPDCYIFQSNVSKFQPVYEYTCVSDQQVIPSNMPNAYAVCYGFLLLDQTTMDILNQIGVCQGLLYFMEYLYPYCYRFCRHTKGCICIIVLLIAFIALEVFLIVADLNVSLMTIVVVALAIVVLGNILLLYYRSLKSHFNLGRKGQYFDLERIS